MLKYIILIIIFTPLLMYKQQENKINQGNIKLIEQLKSQSIVVSKEVEAVMKEIDRGDFADYNPYYDSPQSIGFNVTISAPHMHANALEYLREHLLNGKKSLDVGSGSGYLTLAFAKMMDKQKGISYGIEHIPNLVQQSIENISKRNKQYLSEGRVVIVQGDGRKGLPDYAKYDAIHVGAAAAELYTALVDQLALGGRMVIPVNSKFGGGQDFLIVDKDYKGNIQKQNALSVSYVPLTSVEKQCPNLETQYKQKY